MNESSTSDFQSSGFLSIHGITGGIVDYSVPIIIEIMIQHFFLFVFQISGSGIR